MNLRRTLVLAVAGLSLLATAWAQNADETLEKGAEDVREGVEQKAREGARDVKRRAQRDFSGMYDTSTVETLTGEVAEVEWIKGATGITESLHIILRTETETLTVVLGPQSYLETQNTKIDRGDLVQVTGSRVVVDGTPTIIAAEIEKGNQTLRLREKDGTPLWAGKGRRQGRKAR